MTQTDLNHEVAGATGESVATIEQRGFVPLTSVPYEIESMIDWDDLEEDRVALFGKAWR